MATQLDVLAARSAQGAPARRGRDDRRRPGRARPGHAPPAVAASLASWRTARIPPISRSSASSRPARPAAPRPGKGASQAPPVPDRHAHPGAVARGAGLARRRARSRPRSMRRPPYDAARAWPGSPAPARSSSSPTPTRRTPARRRGARRRRPAATSAGDPDGSCEDFSRAVAEYPAARAMPDALEGLAACETEPGPSRGGEAPPGPPRQGFPRFTRRQARTRARPVGARSRAMSHWKIAVLLAALPALALSQSNALDQARGAGAVQQDRAWTAPPRSSTRGQAAPKPTPVPRDGQPERGRGSARGCRRRTAPPPRGARAGEAAPESYVIQRGDTLWDLSGKYLDSPWYWPKLWSYNPQVENPHWIYPGNPLRSGPGRRRGSGPRRSRRRRRCRAAKETRRPDPRKRRPRRRCSTTRTP